MQGVDGVRQGIFEIVLLQVSVDGLHVVKRHGNRMGPQATVGTVLVLQGLHQVQDDGGVRRVARNRVGCDIDPPVTTIAALSIPAGTVFNG